MPSNLSNACENSKSSLSANSGAKNSDNGKQKNSNFAKNNLLNNNITPTGVTQALPPIKTAINDLVELNCADLMNLQSFSVKIKKTKALGLPKIVTTPKSENSSTIINNKPKVQRITLEYAVIQNVVNKSA